ncbi:hypothetical protein H6768_05275 [Candidatus Peribacteria bacterium]|nr:hypothetical protein [Candidatus Peribacteria bacterium]
MCFYLVQMIIPGVWYLLQKKKYHATFSLFLLPFFFPFWLIAKILFGEKKADTLIPSVGLIDNLPTWVG